MHVAHYLGLLHKAQMDLADAFRQVGEGHSDEVDVFHTCAKLAKQCDAHAEELAPFAERYGEDAPDEPDRLYSELLIAAADSNDPIPARASRADWSAASAEQPWPRLARR